MTTETLTTLLWVAGGGGLAYLMMSRGGGCGSHAHGSRGGEHEHGHGGAAASPPMSPAQAPSPVDAVCGMPVANVRPELQRTHMGRTFSFCSEDCLREFDADPARYAREQERAAQGHAPRC